MSSAVTLGLKRQPNCAFNFSGFLMIGSDSKLLTPMQGCLQGLILLAAGISARGVLVGVFFLYLAVLNQSRSGSAADPDGEITTVTTSLYGSSVIIPADTGAAGKAHVEMAALGTCSIQATCSDTTAISSPSPSCRHTYCTHISQSPHRTNFCFP
jgi:hypothetical protein